MNICKVDDCSTKMYALEYCKKHYNRFKKNGDPLVKSTRIVQGELTCSDESCAIPAYCKGLCRGHYQRQRNGVVIDRPIGKAWREYPFEYVNEKGYVIVRHSRNFADDIPKHRMVMEEILGRELVKGESVHHKNGDRADNRPENLELWSTSQPYGQRIIDKIQWAKEILERYGTDETQYEF